MNTNTNEPYPESRVFSNAQCLLELLQNASMGNLGREEWYAAVTHVCREALQQLAEMKKLVRLPDGDTERRIRVIAIDVYNLSKSNMTEKSTRSMVTLGYVRWMAGELLVFSGHEPLQTCKIYAAAANKFFESNDLSCVDNSLECVVEASNLLETLSAAYTHNIQNSEFGPNTYEVAAIKKELLFLKAKCHNIKNGLENDKIALKAFRELLEVSSSAAGNSLAYSVQLEIQTLALKKGLFWARQKELLSTWKDSHPGEEHPAISWFEFCKYTYEISDRPTDDEHEVCGHPARAALCANAVFHLAELRVNYSQELHLAENAIREYATMIRTSICMKQDDVETVPGMLRLRLLLAMRKKDSTECINILTCLRKNVAGEIPHSGEDTPAVSISDFDEYLKCVYLFSVSEGALKEQRVKQMKTLLGTPGLTAPQQFRACVQFVELVAKTPALYTGGALSAGFLALLEMTNTIMCLSSRPSVQDLKDLKKDIKVVVSSCCSILLELISAQQFHESQQLLSVLEAFVERCASLGQVSAIKSSEIENVYLLFAHVLSVSGNHQKALEYIDERCKTVDSFDKYFIVFKCLLISHFDSKNSSGTANTQSKHASLKQKEGQAILDAALQKLLESPENNEEKRLSILYEVQQIPNATIYFERVLLNLLSLAPVQTNLQTCPSKGTIAAHLLDSIWQRMEITDIKSKKLTQQLGKCLDVLKSCNRLNQNKVSCSFGSELELNFILKVSLAIAKKAIDCAHHKVSLCLHDEIKTLWSWTTLELSGEICVSGAEIDLLKVCGIIKFHFDRIRGGIKKDMAKVLRNEVVDEMKNIISQTLSGANTTKKQKPEHLSKLIFHCRVFLLVMIGLNPRSKGAFVSTLRTCTIDDQFPVSTEFYEALINECVFRNVPNFIIVEVLSSQMQYEMNSNTSTAKLAKLFRQLCHFSGNVRQYFEQALQFMAAVGAYPSDEADWMARTIWNEGVQVHGRLSPQPLSEPYTLQVSLVNDETADKQLARWYFETAIKFANCCESSSSQHDLAEKMKNLLEEGEYFDDGC
jgi:hypothetical protein